MSPALEWTRPWMLWWLVPAIVLLLWYHYRSLSDFAPVQRLVSLGIRMLIALLIALSLAGLVWLTSTSRQMLIVAVDQSASVDQAATDKANAYIQSLQSAAETNDETELRYLTFNKTPSLSSMQWTPPTIAPTDTHGQAMSTDIASAIRAAVASIPPSYVPHVLLLSDGNATVGDGFAAAAALSVPISTVPLPQRIEPEVQIAAVQAPAQVRQGEPFYLEVVVNSNTDATGFIDLYRGDIKIGDEEQQPVTLKAGETKFRVRQSVTGQRQVIFAARMRGFGAADTLLDNNEALAIVSATGRPRVLLIDPETDQTDSLRWALEEQSIDMEVRPLDGIPRDLAELQGYECLMLSNVPATAMTMRQMDLIRTYVQDLGGGLIMLGGDQSFGLGGYYRTQLEEILPVRSNFEKEREKPSLAMVLVIDKSGSMGGEKIELAKDAAKAAVELLGPSDSIGVIAFESSSYWVCELRATSDKAYVIDQISTIDAAGGTSMYPAMQDAYQALAAAPAKLKHCILLTDGISSPGDFEGLASEMAAARMTISTVAMGEGASEDLLQEIARIGNGRYYFCSDPQSVPQVFAKETVEASKSAINELPFVPQLVRPTQVLEGIDFELSPLLLGYVVTRPKPTSEFILASESGDPLLAWWRYGLGVTVAFTSDAKARWASEWISWPDFGTFWAQVIRHAMRKNDAKGVFVEVKRSEENATVVMDTVDNQGNYLNDQPSTITVIDPQLKTTKIEMIQTAPGRYEGSVATPQRGNYQLDLAQTRAGGEAVRQSRGLVVGYPEELRLKPTNVASLKSIAEISSGKFNPLPEALLGPKDRTARLPVPLWPYLLMAALTLFIADVALRRIELA